MIQKTKVMREVSPEWDRLIQLAERIGTGHLKLILNEGRPVQVELVIKKIPLDKGDDFRTKFGTIPIA
ncbi:MAG: hypothetical protein NTX85_03230 [Candidatus Nomurabacteria bacterium]|nr:hypothetical protein [Candidatus Nomurabacteria bacterium]